MKLPQKTMLQIKKHNIIGDNMLKYYKHSDIEHSLLFTVVKCFWNQADSIT